MCLYSQLPANYVEIELPNIPAGRIGSYIMKISCCDYLRAIPNIIVALLFLLHLVCLRNWTFSLTACQLILRSVSETGLLLT